MGETHVHDERTERSSREETRSANESVLRQQLKYVYESSPFYREDLDRAGIIPDGFADIGDFGRAPFATKEDLRERQRAAPPFGRHQACPSGAIVRIYPMSWTAGVPTFIGLTRRDLDVWMTSAVGALWARGLRPSHRIDSIVCQMPA